MALVKKVNKRKMRRGNRGNKSEMRLEKSLGFSPYNVGPTFPQEYGTRIVSAAYSASAGATSSTYEYIQTNSLSNSSTFTTQPQYNANLTNLGKTYAAYRVTKYKITFEIFPRAAKNVWLITGNLSEDPNPGTGSTIDFKLASYPFSRFLLVPSTTTVTPNKVGPIIDSHTIMSVVGREEVLTDDNFSGTINSSGVFSAPAKPTLFYYSSSPFSGAYTAGESPIVKVVMEQWVQFFDRRN